MESNVLKGILISIIISTSLGVGASWYLLTPALSELDSQVYVLDEKINVNYDSLSSELNSNYSNLSYQLTSLQSQLASLNEEQSRNYEDLDSKIESLLALINNLKEELLALQNKNVVQDEEILHIKTELTEIDNMTYHLSYQINGTKDVTSDNFTIRGDSIRIIWDAELSQTNGWLDIRLYNSTGALIARRTSSGVYSTLSSDIYIKNSGDYYIKIETSHVQIFSVSIWDYY